MKILFVAMPFSIHTRRWLAQLDGLGWELHLFPSMAYQPLHEEIRGITYHQNFYERGQEEIPGNTYRSPRLHGLSAVKNPAIKKAVRLSMKLMSAGQSAIEDLRRLIGQLKPDIIHSMETQQAGYLVKEVRKTSRGYFPYWIHSNWGIDLHFFGRLPGHEQAIRDTLSAVDLLIVEGRRDALLAAQFGFNGKTECIPSVGGGFHSPEKELIPASDRKIILIKGAQDLVRRGLFALRAIEMAADILKGYELILYSANEITRSAAKLIEENTGLNIRVLDPVSQEEMLNLNAKARLNICTNKSDGLPNAMLEAMLMGAFPIQSNSSLADEWITDGRTGMLVHPEDPEQIAAAIRTALSDDVLLDRAATINRNLIKDKLEYGTVREKVIRIYKDSPGNRPHGVI